MSRKSQKIAVDRLAQALERRGLALKRHAVIEIAAEAFGLADSNHLAAAAKRGELDPPTSTSATGAELVALLDPTSGRRFAVDRKALEAVPPVVVSPYGTGLLALPKPTVADDRPLWEQIMETRTDDAEAVVTARDGEPLHVSWGPAEAVFLPQIRPSPEESLRLYDAMAAGLVVPSVPPMRSPTIEWVADAAVGVPPAYEQWMRLLDPAIENDVEAGPIDSLYAGRVALVDGQPFLAFEWVGEYEDRGRGSLLEQEVATWRAAVAPAVGRVGGLIVVEDEADDLRIRVAVLLPASRAGDASREDWLDAVRALVGDEHVDRVHATFHPQVWVDDRAVDADAESAIDVTFEVLTMRRETARAMRDDREETDELRFAALAEDRIREWADGSNEDRCCRVSASDAIAEFLDARAAVTADALLEDAFLYVEGRISGAFAEHPVEIEALVARLDAGDDDLSETLDDVADRIKSKLGADLANFGFDDPETALESADRMVADRISNSDSGRRVAAAFGELGRDEAMRLLSADPHGGTDPDAEGAPPSAGISVAMPDGEATIMVDRVLAEPAGPGRWTVVDQYGESHVVERGGDDFWEVVVPSLR